MPELLWEIGCEELPATFVAPTMAQMEKLFADKFRAARLWEDRGTVKTYGTPRRLVLHVADIAARQSDETVTVKGPSEAVAFQNGQPTKAALGFAAKNKIAAEDLQIVDGYVQATVTRAGRSTSELAAELLPQIARELTFPKAMRWGANKLRFARPIRWIVALLDEEIIPFSIEHVSTGRTTRGHRFLSPDAVDVPSAAAYFELMRQKSVLIDPAERREMIVSQAKTLAQETGGEVQIAEELLDENVFLTEYPTDVLGGFDPAYLTLPRPVLVTAMRKHQRYFPLNGPDGALLPNFIAVRNGGGEYLDTVRRGFENVLSARFNDAKFFHDLDTQTPLSAKIDGTKTIVFQEKLGSVYQKALRLQAMLEPSGLTANLSETDAQQLKRAAELSKADLASEMVKELPALQGIVGEEYARRDGEPQTVARAIAEHYMPKGAGDPLPDGEMGRLLAIADRIDTLTGYMGIGIIPTGTSDPYALRRAASGLAALLATSPTLPTVPSLFDAAWQAYRDQQIALSADKEAAFAALRLLLAQRLDAALDEKNVRYDVREAVLAAPFT
ncbi:MAG: glycine--tRNA ligase subunit beta, partial [Armatimonadota bacterium]|nr:glycine--tRNA ligase subunit beta [Armatimonadota bacterium]